MLNSNLTFVVTEQSFYLKIDMRLSCPPGSTSLFQKHSGSSTSQRTYKPLLGSGLSGLEISQPTQALNKLYQLSNDRNHRLLQLSLNLSRDIHFLKEYCKWLELQLESAGFYRQKRFERLSRKETAATIFDNYLDSSTLLSEWTTEGPLHDEIARLQSRNQTLEQQNKQLQSKIGKEKLRLHKSVQVQITDLAKLARESQMAQERIIVLNSEVSHLRDANAAFQLEERKRGVQAGIVQASKQVFDKIHQIMREYRRKMSALAHEKRDIEKKYRILKQNARLTDSASQSKLIDLLAEKVDILEKLVEKQQIELENTITVYEGELTKIEDKRRQELEFFENERIGLETENLRLCIDVQKALNRQDSTNLLLVRQKNTTDRLSKEMVRLTQNLNNKTSKEAQLRGHGLKLDSGVIKFYGESFKLCVSDRRQFNVRNSYHSAGFNLSNDENSNQSNFEYQFSQVSQTGPFEQQLPEMKKKKEEAEAGRYKGMEKIKITYNSYLAPGARGSGYSTLGRVYDSAVQYKRRLVESKPDSSSNNR